MLALFRKAMGLAAFPRFFPTVPHVSKLLADGRPNVAESSSCLLPCMTQGFMCFLVARSKTEQQQPSFYIMCAHKTFTFFSLLTLKILFPKQIQEELIHRIVSIHCLGTIGWLLLIRGKVRPFNLNSGKIYSYNFRSAWIDP